MSIWPRVEKVVNAACVEDSRSLICRRGDPIDGDGAVVIFTHHPGDVVEIAACAAGLASADLVLSATQARQLATWLLKAE